MLELRLPQNAQAQAPITKIITLLEDRGIRHSEPATHALVREINRLLEQGQLDDAKTRLQLLGRIGKGIRNRLGRVQDSTRRQSLYGAHLVIALV